MPSRLIPTVICLATVLGLLAVPSASSAFDPLQGLESGRPAGAGSRRKPPTGIIILGGGLGTYVHVKARGAPVEGSGERVSAGIQLAKRFPRAKLLHTGVEAPPGPLPVLLRAGIPRAQIVIEPGSRNTAENARFSAELVRPNPGDRWILVTSAYHMPRALGCFRRAGFDVEPYPVDFQSSIDQRRAWREYIGVIGYRLLGRCERE